VLLPHPNKTIATETRNNRLTHFFMLIIYDVKVATIGGDANRREWETTH
jgi:hypothetical protein